MALGGVHIGWSVPGTLEIARKAPDLARMRGNPMPLPPAAEPSMGLSAQMPLRIINRPRHGQSRKPDCGSSAMRRIMEDWSRRVDADNADNKAVAV